MNLHFLYLIQVSRELYCGGHARHLLFDFIYLQLESSLISVAQQLMSALVGIDLTMDCSSCADSIGVVPEYKDQPILIAERQVAMQE